MIGNKSLLWVKNIELSKFKDREVAASKHYQTTETVLSIFLILFFIIGGLFIISTVLAFITKNNFFIKMSGYGLFSIELIVAIVMIFNYLSKN